MKTSTKKIIVTILAVVLAFGIMVSAVACDNDTDPNEMAAKLAELDGLLAAKTKELEAANSDNEALTAQLANADSEKSEVSAKIDDLQAVISKMQETEAANQKANQQAIKELNSMIAQLEKAQNNAKLADALAAAKVADTSNGDFSADAYAKLVYIDSTLSDRDCLAGANFKMAQKWITYELVCAGYEQSEVKWVDFSFDKYYAATTDFKSKITAAEYKVNEGKYKKQGRNYVEDENGTYVKVTVTSQNIVLKKQGNTDKQIILGAHYDGDGTGDNGSGVAMALSLAEALKDVETEYTIVFVFFSAEEYGCFGSTAYANAMSDAEKANTLYMINLDSLVCGDYCYLYGGVQDDETKTVSQTEAYENAMAIAEELGLSFKSNPWTYDKPEPGYNRQTGEYDLEKELPDYASPSTGDWSDHKGFKNVGIAYLYCEATNWEIPDYSGYGESYLVGMLMNTSKDYLDYIEQYYPGRIQSHLSQFSQLLYALLTQNNYGE